MGLVIFGVIGLYLLVSTVVVVLAISYARKHNKSTKIWGSGAVLIMYLLVFWDHIPTVVVHKYYCETEAGFWVYKTVDQWNAENLGVMDTLVKTTTPVPEKHVGNRNEWISDHLLNRRIKKISRHNGAHFLYRWKNEGEWVDLKNNEVLARYIDFYTSHERRRAGWSGWKLWLASSHCSGYQDGAIKFSRSIKKFEGREN